MTAGLVVEGASGASTRAGLQIGDPLLAINGRAATSADQVGKRVAARAGSRAAGVAPMQVAGRAAAVHCASWIKPVGGQAP
jgi:S1-C subfamily serine protease